MKSNLEWMKQLPPELVQFLEQLMPLPSVVIRYQQEVRRLEMEILVLGNVLLEKKLITKEELDAMTEKIMEFKKSQYQEEDMQRITGEQQKAVTDEIRNIIDFKAERAEKLKKESETAKKSARLAPIGHNIK